MGGAGSESLAGRWQPPLVANPGLQVKRAMRQRFVGTHAGLFMGSDASLGGEGVYGGDSHLGFAVLML